MVTEPENHPENAESRRHERREQANADYREEGDDMRQGGPDPDLPHRLRSRPGDGNFDPNVQADDQTSDGIAAKIGNRVRTPANAPARISTIKTRHPTASMGATPTAAISKTKRRLAHPAPKARRAQRGGLFYGAVFGSLAG